MSENSTLRIHTQLPPAEAGQAELKAARRRRAGRSRPRAPVPKGRLSFSDRLLRNSALACALLLGILVLGNLRQPWAENAARSIERALSMHIDLDDSIGELTFVRQVMPESALVFLNVSGSAELTPPVDGPLLHSWSSLQPWLVFEAESTPVYAPAAGTVTAVSELSGNRYGLLVDHGDGLESVCANLERVSVTSGDHVDRGQQLGASENGLYFELRQEGEPIDPTERLGL